MASLVLSVAGGAIGGPFGAALGGVLGGVVDRELLFRPKGRQGPRLSELRVQTSSYGTQIPKLYGTMRVAGTVIWATDLIEHRAREGGKGRPTTTSYSYTASFAVALSSRAVLGVGRIWAEGSLLRGADGSFKVQTGFRLHPGSEDQAPDPLIAAAEGMANTPAHRGIAYAVFEDMALAEFGNRIPSLTFEVFADDGCDPAAILAEVGGGVLAADAGAGERWDGFAAQGDSVRAVAETITEALGGWFRAEPGALRLSRGEGSAVALADMGASAGDGGARGARSIAAADAAPRALAIRHYDPARDYQAGLQRAVRPGPGGRETQIELAAAIDAARAKTLAEAALARGEQGRERRMLALPPSALAIAPGARVTIADSAGQWRVVRWTLERMVVALECVRIPPALPQAAASGGRVLASPDRAIGATRLVAFELPPLADTAASVPQLAVAACGTGAGWRGAALLLSQDGGASWSPAGSTALPATMGRIDLPPGPGCAAIEDRASAIEVTLAHAGMALGDADAAALAGGANLALAGEELIQFAHAEPLGGARWRLRGLWRGRRGTEAAIGGQAAGDPFVLLTAETLAVLDLPMASIGGAVQVLAQGAGDSGEGVAAEAAMRGIALVPPAPVHLRAVPRPDGGADIRWVRRSRSGWGWIDAIDAPLGEERERYRFDWAGAGGTRSAELFAPAASLTPDECATGGMVRVRQIGTHGPSPAATLILPARGGTE